MNAIMTRGHRKTVGNFMERHYGTTATIFMVLIVAIPTLLGFVAWMVTSPTPITTVPINAPTTRMSGDSYATGVVDDRPVLVTGNWLPGNVAHVYLVREPSDNGSPAIYAPSDPHSLGNYLAVGAFLAIVIIIFGVIVYVLG